MNLADLIIVVVLLLSVIQAISSGFFQEAFGIAGLVFGYFLAAWRYRHLADHFATSASSRWLVEITIFLAIFLGVMIFAGIVGRIVRWMVKEAGLSAFDRFLGALLGWVRGCLMIAIVLVGITAFTPASRWLQGSALAPYFLVLGRAAIWLAPSHLRAQFYQGLDYLRQGQTATAPRRHE